MSESCVTSAGIAYERSGPRGSIPVVLVHAGVADRRMWDPQWSELTAAHDAVRLDLRGFGASTRPPLVALDPVADLLGLLDELGVASAHLVGASYGAGVVVEAALTRPGLARSLLLAAPGGSLIAGMTPDLRAAFDAERAALGAGDLEAATEANLIAWVDGASRSPGQVDPAVRAAIAAMQRRAFDITAGWDFDEVEPDPPALERLAEIAVPTLVLGGGLDVSAIGDAARRIVAGVPGARRVDWADVAHLPSMERPADFLALLREWLANSAVISTR